MNQVYLFVGKAVVCLFWIWLLFVIIDRGGEFIWKVYKRTWVYQCWETFKVWYRYVYRAREITATIMKLYVIAFSYKDGKNRHHIFKKFHLALVEKEIYRRRRESLDKYNESLD